MGFDGLGFGVKIRKVMVISVRRCHRSVCNHPFLAGILCFLLFLYRLSPFVFSLLVSASPILVCTAALLGTLLSLGQPYIPEIEEEEKSTYEVSSLKSGVMENATVVDRDASFSVERHVSKEEEETTLVLNEISEVKEDEELLLSMPLIAANSRDIQCEKSILEEVGDDSVLEKPEGECLLSLGEVVEDRVDRVPVIDNAGYDNAPAEQSSIVQKDDELISSLLSTWKRVGDDEDDDGECLDSESDGAESSSPDASLADIMPMLDELHPLLDCETPMPAQQLSNDEYDPGSERSHGSSGSSSDESEEDDDERQEEEEEKKVMMKGDGEIKWTEDDQKNLMDLGTSELERNLRLENLIARRRARKSMKLTAEKNLIDIDSVELPFSIAPISVTRRNNPFDLDYDMDVPGSAPSILQPRQNPFDLPYDSSEEKPDLKGDSFQQEFLAFHQRESSPRREAFFRRHESFNLGPSTLGRPRSNTKWKPFLFPDWLATEENGSGIFQRQLSGVSESMMSSVPDSVSGVDHGEGSQTSGDNDDSLCDERAENRDAHLDMDEMIPGDVESPREMESNLSDMGAASHFDYDVSEIHSRIEAVDGGCSSRSSLSSLIGADEKVFTFTGEEFTSLEPRGQAPPFPESSFHFITGQVDDNQHKEPVYENPFFDISPLSTENLLSFSSASSDTQPDVSELGLPIMLNESRHQEPELHGAFFQEETEPSQVSSSSVNLNRSMVPEYLLEQFPVDSGSISLENGSAEEGIVKKVDNFHQDHYQGDSLTPVGLLLEADRCLSEDLDYKLEQQQTSIHRSISSEAEPANLQETQLKKSEALESSTLDDGSVDKTDKEDTILAEPNPVSSSSFDADINVDDNHEKTNLHPPSVFTEVSQAPKDFYSAEDVILMNQVELSNSDSLDAEVVSPKNGQQAGPNEDNCSLVSEKQLALSDKSIGEPSFAGHGESQEPFAVVAESEAEENIIDNVDEKNGAESPKGEQPSEGEEYKGSILDEILREEFYLSDVVDENVVEGDNEIKESIDEAMLLELDAVGDFNAEEVMLEEANSEDKKTQENNLELPIHEARSYDDTDSTVKEHRQGADSEEVIPPSMIEESKDFTDDSSLLPAFEERSVEDTDMGFKQLPEGAEIEEAMLPNLTEQSQDSADISSQLPAFEAKSVEDTDMALKQLPEGADSEEVILPSLTEGSQDSADIYSQLPDFEARSVEDTDMALKQLPEGADSEEVILPSLTEQSRDSADINSQLPAFEERSVEDTDTAFKQLPEGADSEEVILPSITEQSQDSADINSQLPAVEARSVEDTDMAFKQLPEGADSEEVILPSMIEQSQDSADINSQLPAFETRSVEDTDMAFKQLPEGADSEEVILPSIIEDSKDSADINSQLPALEARSVEDTDMAFKQLPEEADSEEVILLTTTEQSLDSADINSQLPAVEARSIEDTDMASKQLPEGAHPEEVDSTAKEHHQGADTEEVIPSSMIEESKDFTDNSSHLPAFEARSVEDTDIAIKQLPEGADSEEVSLASLTEQSQGTEFSNVESDIQEHSQSRNISSTEKIESDYQEGRSNEVVATEEIESETGESNFHGSSMTFESKAGDEQDGIRNAVPSKEAEPGKVESSVEDEAHGCHGVITSKQVESNGGETSV